jgi:D-arabinose 1-dehydrogenase-like Zn-dependent alcohol dehydrogenase
VIGAGGGVGIHMVQVAQAFGAEVAALEASPPKLAHLESELGVAPVHSADFASASLPAAWSGGADVVVDLVGTAESRTWGIEHLADRGRFVFLASAGEVTIPSRRMTAGELTLLGSRYASRAEVHAAGELVASGRVRPVVSRHVAADEVEAVHGELRAGTLLGRAALVWD